MQQRQVDPGQTCDIACLQRSAWQCTLVSASEGNCSKSAMYMLRVYQFAVFPSTQATVLSP